MNKEILISKLSAVAGVVDAWSEGVCAWANEDGDYWLRLLDVDATRPREILIVHVDEELAPSDQFFTVVGLIHYFKLNHSFTSWDEFLAEEEDA